jgi:hypothetical protein
MEIEQYKIVILNLVQGFTKPYNLNEILAHLKFPEQDRKKIQEAVLELLNEQKIKFNQK